MGKSSISMYYMCARWAAPAIRAVEGTWGFDAIAACVCYFGRKLRPPTATTLASWQPHAGTHCGGLHGHAAYVQAQALGRQRILCSPKGCQHQRLAASQETGGGCAQGARAGSLRAPSQDRARSGGLLDLAAVGDRDLLGGLAAARAERLHLRASPNGTGQKAAASTRKPVLPILSPPHQSHQPPSGPYDRRPRCHTAPCAPQHPGHNPLPLRPPS